ncbi:MAG TPA: hypothetical protein VKX46_11925, partial [Ktedonobacteraceae bacterium]|nr:hypothetical protein [Ktedonobacteraceae bacterium]
IFGGEQIIHGHTPISLMVNSKPQKVTAPWIYANGRCVNVDGGIYMGGPGFLYQIPTTAPSPADTPG